MYSCLLSMIEDKTQSEIGEKDRPAEGGRYNLSVQTSVCVCMQESGQGSKGAGVCVWCNEGVSSLCLPCSLPCVGQHGLFEIK